jgi:hypothetical protein
MNTAVTRASIKTNLYFDVADANAPNTLVAIESICCAVIFTKTPPEADDAVLWVSA